MDAMIVTAIHTAIVMASRMALFEFRLNQYVCFDLARALVSCTCGGEVFVVGCIVLRNGVDGVAGALACAVTDCC